MRPFPSLFNKCSLVASAHNEPQLFYQFECYTSRLQLKTNTIKFVCHNEVGLCSLNIDIIIGSMINKNGESMHDDLKRKRIITLTCYNISYYLKNCNMNWQSWQFTQIANSMKQFPIRSNNNNIWSWSAHNRITCIDVCGPYVTSLLTLILGACG